jgi:hypothetical protein
MFRTIRAAAAASLILAAAPAAACAQSVSYSTSPVTLTSCRTVSTYDPASFTGLSELTPANLRQTQGIVLSYINTAAMPATSVTFVFNDGGKTQRVVARGSFAHNVQIDRTIDADVSGTNASAECRVADVQFADGTTWHADRRDLVRR